MMDKWSKKYQQWFRILEFNKHPKHKSIYKFGNYWYRIDKDILIHNDVIDEYIEKSDKLRKLKRKEQYLKKNNIEIK